MECLFISRRPSGLITSLAGILKFNRIRIWSFRRSRILTFGKLIRKMLEYGCAMFKFRRDDGRSAMHCFCAWL